MLPEKTNRRDFLRTGIVAGASAGAFAHLTAASYARILGANERINLGVIGCGTRGRYIVENMIPSANADIHVVAVSDIWKYRMETYPDQVAKQFGQKPRAFADYRTLLDDQDVDAVIIATPDHQHCGQLIDAVAAGKHVYVEKPIAPLMEGLADLNKCYDAVKASDVVVQHGTHGTSGPQTPALRDLLAKGSLGKLFRVETSISLLVPFWTFYTDGPKTEAQTNWKAFLYGKPDRPFDPDIHAAWMGYYDYSSGPIGGWLPHFINLVHAATGSGCPRTATAWGGRYTPGSDRRRTAPDNVCVLLEYDEGFYTQFVTHFGSVYDTETTRFMLEKGMVQCRFGHDPGNPVVSSEGVGNEIPSHKLLDEDPPYPGAAHVRDWAQAIRNSTQAAANMEMGYRQGIAVILADAAYRLQQKMAFDPATREIKPA
jgi:predicted dehydrogenase